MIMRNRLSRIGDKAPPEETIKTPISEEQRRHEKERQKNRKKKQDDPNRQVKLDRLEWVIRHNGLVADEATLKRARITALSDASYPRKLSKIRKLKTPSQSIERKSNASIF